MSGRPLNYEARPRQPSRRGFWIAASVVIGAIVLFALWFISEHYLFLLYDD